MKTGIEAIAEAREKQIKKGHTPDDDLEFNSSQPLALIKAATFLINFSHLVPKEGKPDDWNDAQWQKMCAKPYLERLAIAGALIAAEFDRYKLLRDTTKGDQ